MMTLIKAVAGSKLYGTNTHESDDDFMGIFVSTPEQKLGLTTHTHVGQDDDIMYELSRYVQLAASGNPTILQLMYTPQSYWVQWDERWERMQNDLRALTVSEKCRTAFIGYMTQQMKKMDNSQQQRPELVAKYGFDTKFAAHALRLASMGCKLLTTGTLTFPVSNARFLCDVRNGLWEELSCRKLMHSWLKDLQECPTVLPPEPDYGKINQWLAKTYKEWWGWTTH